jgi:replicative DNA helicase
MNEIVVYQVIGVTTTEVDTMPFDRGRAANGALFPTTNDVFDRVASIMGPQHFWPIPSMPVLRRCSNRIAKKTCFCLPVTLKHSLEDDEGPQRKNSVVLPILPACCRWGDLWRAVYAAKDYAQMIYNLATRRIGSGNRRLRPKPLQSRCRIRTCE